MANISLSIPEYIKSNKEELRKFNNYFSLVKSNIKEVSLQSLANSLVNVYDLNLSVSPIKKELALIPYGNDLQVQIQEDGWLTLLNRGGRVVNFQREKITSTHRFNEDTNKWEINPRDIFKRDGVETVGYYCYIQIKDDNGKLVNFYKGMTKKEIEEWKYKYAKKWNKEKKEWEFAKSWIDSFDQMALKTVVKATIRDIMKAPNITQENKYELDKALQLDQGVIIDTETVAYKDNTGDQVKIIKPIEDNKVNVSRETLEEDIAIIYHNQEAEEQIKKEELSIYKELQKGLEEMELDGE